MFLYLMIFMLGSAAWAEASEAKPSLMENLFPFIIIAAVFYFLLIRPNQKKQKYHQDFLGKLKRGDEVLTSGGIYGTIEGITEQFVILEVDDNTRIRVVKSQINSYINPKEASKTDDRKLKS